MSTLAAIILAAGVSSRMGKFKPLLPVDGQTMAQRVVCAMLAAGADPVVVVTGYRAEELETHLANAGVTFVRNKNFYRTQMLDSLLLGAKALPTETERVLMCPVDIPLVKPETIAALLQAEGDFVRPVCKGQPGHPAVLARSLFRALENFHGDGGLRAAVKDLGIVPVDVPVDDRGATLDGDTRDEYAKLLKYRREETGQLQPLQLDLRMYLQAETSFWGPDCMQFLELIQTAGSILSACQCMHMSYSRGWGMLNEAERQLGYPLLIRSQGGANGGGSELTVAGTQFLSAFRQMDREIRAVSNKIFQKYFPLNPGESENDKNDRKEEEAEEKKEKKEKKEKE